MRYPVAFGIITLINFILCTAMGSIKETSTAIICMILTIVVYKIYSKIRYTSERMKIHRHMLNQIKKDKEEEEWKWF